MATHQQQHLSEHVGWPNTMLYMARCNGQEGMGPNYTKYNHYLEIHDVVSINYISQIFFEKFSWLFEHYRTFTTLLGEKLHQ
jgi:hypothetical protein